MPANTQKQPLSCKHEVAVYFVFYALSSKLSCRLLNDSSNTTRTYCSTTFTLPVLALSLSSTMFFIDFMLFLGTIYIMYFYFPKLLEPFWSHLDSNTSIVICTSFCHNNSYETESIICSTYWNLQKLKNT